MAINEKGLNSLGLKKGRLKVHWGNVHTFIVGRQNNSYFGKHLNIHLPYDPVILLLVHTPPKQKHMSHKDVNTLVQNSTIHNDLKL